MALGYTYRGHFDGAAGSDNLTTSAISCVAGDVLAVTVVCDSFSGTTAFITVTTNSPSWGFTENLQYDEEVGGAVGVFALVVPSNASPTITVTITGAAAGHRRPSCDVWTITGADVSGDLTIQTDTTAFVGRNGNLVFTSAAGATGNPTFGLIAAVDTLHNDAPYVYGDGVTPGFGFAQSGPPGPPGVSGFGTMVSWAESNTTYVTSVQLGTGYPLNPICLAAVMEFAPAPTPPTVGAGADTSVERTKTLTRTATEDANGATITAREWKIQAGTGAGTVLSTSADLSWTPTSAAGAYTLRYSATNSAGTGTDDVVVTVTALRPVVGAGADEVISLSDTVTRTASEVAGDSAISSRLWYVYSGPAEVGTTIGTAAALSWTPSALGTYVIRYTATSAAGTSDPDYATITVGVLGVELHIPTAAGADGPPKLGVAIAFGGDLTDPDGSDWAFTEVTTDVRVDSGVHLKHGRSDEASASQPATCKFTLDNRQGKYSLGGRSPYWPNVRQGTPVAVYLDLQTGDGMEAHFIGYADGFTPAYSQNPLVSATGRGDATVEVTASGVLRRMNQGAPVIISPIKRGIMQTSGLRAYWPCEDLPNAQFIASAFPDHPGMDFSGRVHAGGNPNMPAKSPRFASSSVFDCSDPLMTINDSECYGRVPDYTNTSVWECWCLIDFPEQGTNDETVILGVITTGDPAFWELRYKQTGNGTVTLRAWRYFTTMVLDVDAITTNWQGFTGVNGRRGMLGFRISTSGSAVAYAVGFVEVGATGSVGTSGSVASSTVGRPIKVQTTTDGGHVDVTMGHIFVVDTAVDPAEQLTWVNAYNNEIVGERLLRMATENTLPYTQPDGDVHFVAVTDRMGPQRRGTPLEIFRDCETCDQGILWDGVHPGITYTTKRYRESRPAAMTLDASAGEVAMPFAPTHDDSGRRNRVEATRTGGASSTYEDTDGPLGSDIVGRYDDSINVNVHADSSTFYYAGWLVHQGTIEGYRWPRLALRLEATPHLYDDWAAVRPGDRIDIVNLNDVNASAPEEPIMLSVEGYEQTITDSSWTVQINCSPQYQWAVACAAATTGDTQDFCARVDTDGSTVTSNIAAGQVTLSATTTSGPLWTTTADDFPMYLDVGDVMVRATACSGTSSPQTFTIDPMLVARPAGTAIKLWRQPVLGL